MNSKTLVMAAVVIAATTALATAPAALDAVMHNADAAQPRDCFHKGTGDEIDCSDARGSNSINCNRGGNQCTD
jgi:hypothetical protein